MRTVGRYELLEEIGRGATAIVYRARHHELDRVVAIKEMASFAGAGDVLARRFLHEARLASSLHHANIVTVLDFFRHDGTPFIVMEYLRQGALRRYTQALTDTQAMGVLHDLLAALAHAGERGIVHRDLKPENLLVSDDGRLKIADFGIARLCVDDATANRGGALDGVMGTPGYMAPEQILGGPIGPWTDLYAVGAIAFELFARRLPFPRCDVAFPILVHHARALVPPLAAVRSDVPPALSGWVARLLTKDPCGRPSCAATVRDQLDEIAVAQFGWRWKRRAAVTVDASASILPAPVPPPRPAIAALALKRERPPRHADASWVRREGLTARLAQTATCTAPRVPARTGTPPGARHRSAAPTLRRTAHAAARRRRVGASLLGWPTIVACMFVASVLSTTVAASVVSLTLSQAQDFATSAISGHAIERAPFRTEAAPEAPTFAPASIGALDTATSAVGMSGY